jgi:hypothetical protein
MKSVISALLFVIQAAFGATEGNVPGRFDRMFHKRAPRDLGTWAPDCKGREAACNNACYYIRCMVCCSDSARCIVWRINELIRRGTLPMLTGLRILGRIVTARVSAIGTNLDAGSIVL